jgi:hypothetical protein
MGTDWRVTVRSVAQSVSQKLTVKGAMESETEMSSLCHFIPFRRFRHFFERLEPYCCDRFVTFSRDIAQEGPKRSVESQPYSIEVDKCIHYY